MKKLLNVFVIFLLTLSSHGQYNYVKPNIDTIDVTDVKNFPMVVDTKGYWEHSKSREEFHVGLAVAGMSGLAFYFHTIGDGPYRAFGYTFGTISVAKLTSAAIWRKRENEGWRYIP